jgi:hypothetical protein
VDAICLDGLCLATDCTRVNDGRFCTVGDSPGICFEDVCRLSDCSDLADGTRCAKFSCYSPPVPFPDACFLIYGWCWHGSCSTGIGDCTGFEDLTTCNVAPVALGLCIDDSCEPTVSDCVGEQDGTLCRPPLNIRRVIPPPGGFCVDGSCEEPQ